MSELCHPSISSGESASMMQTQIQFAEFLHRAIFDQGFKSPSRLMKVAQNDGPHSPGDESSSNSSIDIVVEEEPLSSSEGLLSEI